MNKTKDIIDKFSNVKVHGYEVFMGVDMGNKEIDLKKGDYVTGNYFKGVKQIEEMKFNVALVDGEYRDVRFLTLVCGFTKGEKIRTWNKTESIFLNYRPELKCPYECVGKYSVKQYLNNEPYGVCHVSYAKAIEPELKYKAYTGPKLEWIGKEVKDKFGVESTIRMIGSGYVNFKENNNEASCEDLFKNYTWIDGSVCGELI